MQVCNWDFCRLYWTGSAASPSHHL